MWVLDPQWLNSVVADIAAILQPGWDPSARYLPRPFDTTPKLPEAPIAIEPPEFADRLLVQRSRFTIHGSSTLPLEKIEIGSPTTRRLAKIIVSKSAIEWIKVDLEMCGMVETTVFPDLEGLAREICPNVSRLPEGGRK